MNKTLLLEKTQKYLKMNARDITEKESINLVGDLRNTILGHNNLYYIYASPIIADGQYDQLFSLLVSLEEKFPNIITPDSPTQILNIPIAEGFTKKEHGQKILSLKNSYNAEDLRDWVSLMKRKLVVKEEQGEKGNKKRDTKKEKTMDKDSELGVLDPCFSYIVEPKFDGSSVHLIYRYGKFVAGITRGDGVVGEDVTENMRMVRNLPLFLSGADNIKELHFRAEVMLPKNAFEKMNQYQKEEGLALFANPRNATAGTLRQLNPDVVRKRGLVIFIHEFMMDKNIQDKQKGKNKDNRCTTYTEEKEFLKTLGLPVFDWEKKYATIDSVIACCENKKTEKMLEEMNLEFDGLVIKLDNLLLREKLGTTEHHPRWAMAYKFPAKQVATRLYDITYQIGRTGAITPVAELDPVKLSGAMIARATLHNFDYIKNLDIRKGDMVRVQRSGEVIPYILGPIKESRTGTELPLTEPTRCPVCTTVLMRKEGEVALLCPSENCPAKIKEQLKHFVSKSCMNIDGLGEQVIDMLLKTKLIKNIVDIYRLNETEKRMKLRALPGLGAKKITQILTEIEKSKNNPLWRLLHGFGISYVGKKVAQVLEKEIYLLEGEMSTEILLQFMGNKVFLLEIFGLGEQGVNALVLWFSEKKNVDMLEELEQCGMQILKKKDREMSKDGGKLERETSEEEEIQKIFDEQSIVITGVFPIKRNELSQWIETRGGKVTESVTKKTTFVLYGNKSGSKKVKAEKIGIDCVSRKRFILQYPNVTLLILSEKKQEYRVQGGLFG